MRKALLAVAGAALMGTILVAPASSKVGLTFSVQVDPDRAIADSSEAIRLDPKDAIAYNNRGMAYYSKGDLERAVADFNEAIRIDPKDAIAYNNRGAAHGAKGDLFRNIIYDSHWLVPKAAFHYKDPAHRAKGDLGLAIADFSEAIRLAPNDAIIHNNRGAAYGASGDLDRAIADFSEAIRLDPKRGEAFNQRCYALAIIGQTQQALADCNESLRLSDDTDTLDSRGFAYLNAIIDYDSVLKRQSQTASSLYGRGVAKLKKGDSTGGISDIAAAKAIQADIADQFSRVGIMATE